MLHSAYALLLFAHLVAALFYHELSLIDLKDGNKNSAYGFSLGYESGDARLVIGAPLYNEDGRVYHCSVDDIKHKKCNDPVSVDFTKISNRTDSKQSFYLGASIAATKNGFVVCAPLRTAYFGEDTKDSQAFGACFVYDHVEKTPKPWYLHSKTSAQWIADGGGWSTLVDEKNDRIVISQLFTHKSALCSHTPKAENYTECFIPNSVSLVTTYGQAISFGNYFEQNKTCYAFSVNSIGDEKNYIEFFADDTNASGVGCPPTLKEGGGETVEAMYAKKSVGTMFGAGLCSADVTGDGLAELFVGAPAQVRGPTNYDTGAVHVYSKTVDPFNNETTMDLKLRIWGVADGARFGTTLSSNDVNGDSYPEIIVSAPFEKSGGVLYILCGYALHERIKEKRPKALRTTSVWELPRTQIIRKSQSFGFSLQPFGDFNENGSDELAVGAPEGSTVTVFQGVRAITANVTSEFTLNATETNTEFSFDSCVTIEKPGKPKSIAMKLLVKNVLTGDKATFKNNANATYELDLAVAHPTSIKGNYTLYQYCQNYLITSPLFCKVNTTVSWNENIIEKEKKFHNTWVTLSPQSILTKETQPQCNCDGGPCTPNYFVELVWAGKTGGIHDYIVGSSDMETVTIVVRNNGTMGCGACAIVRVSGTVMHTLPCGKDKGKCDLPAPFRTGTNKTIDIQLQTNTLSTEEKSLMINVEVRKECSKPEAVHSSLLLNYDYTNVLENVSIQGYGINRTISEAELKDSREDKLSMEQTFTIFNNQSFKWNKVKAIINVMDNVYIHDSTIRIGQPNKVCEKQKNNYVCFFALAPNSTTPITISYTIIKSKLGVALSSHNARILSKLDLQLLPGRMEIKSITTVLRLEDKPKSMMGTIFIAIGVALLVLFIIGFILYKLNFFKRKKKEDLEQLKRHNSMQSSKSDNQTQKVEPEVESVPQPDHDFDMVDLIVDETPLAKSLSSEQLNCIAANPDSIDLDKCPKKKEFNDKEEFTHV